MNEIYIISEICGQWGGSVRKAEQMILQSKIAGANAVKIQLYDTYKMPGTNRERWEYLSMTKEVFLRLKLFCESLNIDFFASAFDKERFEWISDAHLKKNKIASAMLGLDFELCREMVESNMLTFCSLGRWTDKDLPFSQSNVIYFHCLPKYPHYYEEALSRMPLKFESPLLGYSDHSIGLKSCFDAVDRGAKFIEKHFTLDHNLQSELESAHICSMNVKQLEELRLFCDRRNNV